MKSPIQSVEVSYLVHATEDPEKVGRAVAALLRTSRGEATERLQGHYGNEIFRVRIHLTGDEAARACDSLFVRMQPVAKAEVLGGLDSFIDQHSALFLRLDKQALVSGEVAPGSADPVRIKIKPRGFMVRGGAAAFYQDLIGRR